MDYYVKEVDIYEPDTIGKINLLVGKTFGSGTLPDGKIDETTNANSQTNSLYLAATKDNEVIGFLAFISHDFALDDFSINCYQCCLAATDINHRGKKIFQNLVNEGKRILSARGAAFVFAYPFPGSDSHFLFTKKLDFKEIPSLKWQCPNAPFVTDFFFSNPAADADALQKNSVLQNDRQLIELKKKQCPNLLIVEHENSFLWGIKREKKKFGLTLSYFDIGGVQLSDVADVKALFRTLTRRTGRVAYFQLVTSAGNSYNQLFDHIRPAQTDSLVVFDLNLDTTENIHFNLFAGVKDVF